MHLVATVYALGAVGRIVLDDSALGLLLPRSCTCLMQASHSLLLNLGAAEALADIMRKE